MFYKGILFTPPESTFIAHFPPKHSIYLPTPPLSPKYQAPRIFLGNLFNYLSQIGIHIFLNIMSITCSLLLLLLCLSFHASDARSLCATIALSEKNFPLSHKTDEKNNGQVKISVPLQKHKAIIIHRDRVFKSARVDHDDENCDHKPINSKADQKVLKHQRLKNSGEMETKSRVSWLVPRKKQTEHQPGFNLDYSPPKTHPPVHN